MLWGNSSAGIISLLSVAILYLISSTRLYDHVTALWEQKGWLPEASVEFSRAHYAAYMVKRADGLRVISLDTNLCKAKCLTGMSTNKLVDRVQVRNQ